MKKRSAQSRGELTYHGDQSIYHDNDIAELEWLSWIILKMLWYREEKKLFRPMVHLRGENSWHKVVATALRPFVLQIRRRDAGAFEHTVSGGDNW